MDLDTRSITFNKGEKETITPLVKSKLENLPVNIPFTITDSFRTEAEYKWLKDNGYEVTPEYHDHGDSIDIRTDENGHKFIDWLKGEGIEWAKKNVKKVMRHGAKGGTDHYHIEFK